MTARPPVCVFAFRRPEHLRRTLSALAANDGAAQTRVTIFCDGARDERDLENVAKVRSIARHSRGFGHLRVVERETNMGLSRSIISGLSEALTDGDRVIVVEDDLVTAPGFLNYMRDGLNLYADHPRVASVHGYLYPTPGDDVPETFFVRGADCWGWGTWARAWRGFEPDGRKLLGCLRAGGLLEAFNHGGRAPMFGRMLEDQIAGRNDSWAIRWHASMFLANQLTLYPGRSLVQNIGFDSTGTHCDGADVYGVALSADVLSVQPIPVEIHAAMTARFADFFASLEPLRKKPGWRRRLQRVLDRFGRNA